MLISQVDPTHKPIRGPATIGFAPHPGSLRKLPHVEAILWVLRNGKEALFAGRDPSQWVFIVWRVGFDLCSTQWQCSCVPCAQWHLPWVWLPGGHQPLICASQGGDLVN